MSSIFFCNCLLLSTAIAVHYRHFSTLRKPTSPLTSDILQIFVLITSSNHIKLYTSYNILMWLIVVKNHCNKYTPNKGRNEKFSYVPILEYVVYLQIILYQKWLPRYITCLSNIPHIWKVSLRKSMKTIQAHIAISFHY